ncbi:hypothetical protein BC829DRAFT_386120 [Chytridium lagenaria]|nr:hypothetical protein BC829DRAFT_386120 [Chytridium lagenaria]
MAKGAVKKIAENNSKILQRHYTIHLIVVSFVVAITALFKRASFSFYHGAAYVTLNAILLFVAQRIQVLTTPRMDSGKMESVSMDLGGAETEYIFDVIYVIWFTMVASCISDYFVIPLFAACKVVTQIMSLFGYGGVGQKGPIKKGKTSKR